MQANTHHTYIHTSRISTSCPPHSQTSPAGRSTHTHVPGEMSVFHHDSRIGGEGELARRVGIGVPARLWGVPPAPPRPPPPPPCASPGLFGAYRGQPRVSGLIDGLTKRQVACFLATVPWTADSNNCGSNCKEKVRPPYPPPTSSILLLHFPTMPRHQKHGRYQTTPESM